MIEEMVCIFGNDTLSSQRVKHLRQKGAELEMKNTNQGKSTSEQFHIRTNLAAGDVTVYGQEWCSWTKKQKEYLQGKNIPFTYVDCEKETCPEFVKSYPTLVLSGYKEI
jgi:hypothetical protein